MPLIINEPSPGFKGKELFFYRVARPSIGREAHVAKAIRADGLELLREIRSESKARKGPIAQVVRAHA